MKVATLHEFCRRLLHWRPSVDMGDPEALATEFVLRFGVSKRPKLDELKRLMLLGGFGNVQGHRLGETLRGAHFGYPGRCYEIYYRKDMWRGAIEHTVLHEAFEIICETLGDMRDRPPKPCTREMCRRADRFAAAVLMQRDTFAASARARGFDVIALHEEFGRSFASVTMRLAEVLDDPPLAAVLYENRLKRSCAVGPSSNRLRPLRETVACCAPGFEPPIIPQRPFEDREPLTVEPSPDGSLAELAARTRTPLYAELKPCESNSQGFAAAVRPYIWRGRLTKVVVLAVPHRRRDTLKPQLAATRFNRFRARMVGSGETATIRRSADGSRFEHRATAEGRLAFEPLEPASVLPRSNRARCLPRHDIGNARAHRRRVPVAGRTLRSRHTRQRGKK